MSEKSSPSIVTTSPSVTDVHAGDLASPAKGHRVGNLTYTKAGLVSLFFWLLWIDFCFTLMEGAFGPIIQFKLLNDLKCDPALFAMIMGTIPSILNFVMNPIISIKSDRHRGPLGRRIPFLLYSTPVVCLFLGLMGFGNEIGAYAHATFFSGMSVEAVTIWVFAILFLVFSIFNMFLQTTFYYLFNDVVPKEHIIKFMAYFRVVGTLAGMVYGWFIFGLSDKSGPLSIDLGFLHYSTESIWYPKLILVGMAIFYMVGFTIACLKVKEPSYPPPAPLAKGEGFIARTMSTLRTLVLECFSHRFYWVFFITMTMDMMVYQTGNYTNPMLKDLGVNIDYIGKIGSVSNFVTLALYLLTANYGDRFRALPLMVAGMIGMVVTAPIGLLFLIPGLAADTYFWIQVAYNLSHIPVGIVYGMGASPLYMDLMPKERFGQFGAAASMIRAVVAGILGSLLAGALMKLMKGVHGDGDYYLRYAYVWKMFFQVITLICFIILYREWKKLGGKDGYKPPAVGPVAA